MTAGRWQQAAAVVVLATAIWLPRVWALDRVVTPDEPTWLTTSANFYRALVQGNLAETYQIEHPGVTVMWIGTLGYLARYPDYPQEATQQIAWWQEEVGPLLRAQGHGPLEVLTASRLVMANVITIVLLVGFWAAVRLLGLGPAWVGCLLIAADPFHIAHSRLLHLDGLASSLVVVSLLGLLNFIYRGRRQSDLMLSGAAAGLAWLTKSPTLFLIPFAGLVVLLDLAAGWRQENELGWSTLRRAALALVAWGSVGAVVFVLLWPAMWVDPLWTLWRVLRATVGYAVGGHEAPLYFNGTVSEGDPGWYFYPVTYLWRTTPTVLVGLALAGAAMLLGRARGLGEDLRRPLGLLLVFAVLFTVFMSLGAKKFDRYLLPVYPPLALAAGVGWVAGAGWLAPRLSRRTLRRMAAPALLVLAGVGTLPGLAAAHPYYLSYYNPLLGGTGRAPTVMMVGWGEGLDQAARFLNTQAGAGARPIMLGVWNGTFSYFYDGVVHASDFMPGAEVVRAWETSDFCLVYINQWQRQRLPRGLLDYLAQRPPVLAVQLQGLTYAYVYEIRGLPPPTYMLGPNPAVVGSGD